MPDLSSVRDAWRIDRAGSLDRLRRVSEPIAPPGPGEARIAVKAIGLNFADVFACLGLYSATPTGSFVPGLEFSGVVEALGPSPSDAGGKQAALVREPSSAASDPVPVHDATPTVRGEGDTGKTGPVRKDRRVFGVTRFGGYATALNVDTRFLQPLPEVWSFEQGAGFPVQALTAWYGLVRLARVASGEVVLVHSAAGGVGLHALRILRTVGAPVIATVGHRAKQEFLVQRAGLEPAAVIVRDRARFGAQLDEALRASRAPGLDIAFDAIAGPFFTATYARLRPEGRHVIYGAADFMTRGARPDYLWLLARYLRRPRLDPIQMIAENRSVVAFNLIWLWDAIERLTSGYDALQRLITDPPFVGRTFRFDAVPNAMRWLQGGESVGKVVVSV